MIGTQLILLKTIAEDSQFDSGRRNPADSPGQHRSKISIEADFTGALVTAEDVFLALDAFSFLHFCLPPNVMESAQLGFFYSTLLEKENMRTVVVATLNTMLDDEVQYSSHLLDDIFAELDKNYNFMLGPAILALASTSQLRQIVNKDYPFLTEYKHQIKDCLEDPKCETFSQLDFWTGKKINLKIWKIIS